VADIPAGFVADLRHLRRWPELADSLWRSPVLVELTHGRLRQLVAEALPSPPAQLLDIGCGTGAISLEMARAGYDVTAIDPDPSAIEIAERSSHDSRPGRLTYHQGDVGTWVADEAAFDVVVSSRVLHHVPEPAVALERIHRWLRPGGQFVCVDFLYDRFDRSDARWLAQMRGLLEATGSYRRDGRLPTSPDSAVERITAEWAQDHVVDQDLNGSADIEDPLDRLFPTHTRSWHPYLYWDILEGLDLPEPAAERATATLVADWEGSLLRAGQLSPVLLRFVGHRDPG
jgi:ubiquinone/menaquinone biosynthesis C-methylase UbiE